MKEKVFMSWKWVDDQIEELAERLKDKKLRYISGIPRGGLIPAIMLSHKLGVTYIPFDEAKKYGRHDIRFKNEDILLVDDICDSGVTMKDYAPRFITATLCLRYISETIPEYYGEKIEDDRWLVFPWERNDSNTKQNYLDN
jgi:hypoxanthine phosphoribosyltransferase